MLSRGNIPLNSRNADEITQSERLLQEQDNAREEVLKNILKCKPYGEVPIPNTLTRSAA
jgi:hypothetical protein